MGAGFASLTADILILRQFRHPRVPREARASQAQHAAVYHLCHAMEPEAHCSLGAPCSSPLKNSLSLGTPPLVDIEGGATTWATGGMRLHRGILATRDVGHNIGLALQQESSTCAVIFCGSGSTSSPRFCQLWAGRSAFSRWPSLCRPVTLRHLIHD